MKTSANTRVTDPYEGATSHTRLVYPTEAREMRNISNFIRQREIDGQWVDKLNGDMIDETFNKGTQIYIGVLPDLRQLILNGNHTLEALAKLGKPYLLTLTYIPVRDLNHAGQIYGYHDNQKNRSMRDTVRALGEEPDHRLVAAVAGTRIIEAGFGGASASHTKGDKVKSIQFARQYADEIAAFFNVVHNTKHAKRLKTGPFMSVAFAILKYQRPRAVEFITRIAEDDGLLARQAEKWLLDRLRDTPTTGHANRAAVMMACASAWNTRFQSDRRTARIAPIKDGFYLLGTPWETPKSIAAKGKKR